MTQNFLKLYFDPKVFEITNWLLKLPKIAQRSFRSSKMHFNHYFAKIKCFTSKLIKLPNDIFIRLFRNSTLFFLFDQEKKKNIYVLVFIRLFSHVTLRWIYTCNAFTCHTRVDYICHAFTCHLRIDYTCHSFTYHLKIDYTYHPFTCHYILDCTCHSRVN